MQRVVKLKLQASPPQKAILRDTVAHCTACFNTVATVAWEKRLTNGVKLHHETYYPLHSPSSTQLQRRSGPTSLAGGGRP